MFRISEDVDIQAGEAGSHYVGWTQDGEFTRYTVVVQAAGTLLPPSCLPPELGAVVGSRRGALVAAGFAVAPFFSSSDPSLPLFFLSSVRWFFFSFFLLCYDVARGAYPKTT